MDAEKPKAPRRVAPYDEPAMRKRNIRLTAEQHAELLVIGDGNLSLGVRRVIERVADLERILPKEGWEELQKKSQAKKTSKKAIKPLPAKPVGRPAITDETIKKAQEMYSHGRSIKEITVALQIHQSTIYKYLDVRKKSSDPP
ncbi:terminase gpP N-terminus-related DNA-binding protein [Lampropedia hyalina]|jgi:DNA invertase Pin-like site-specific DNA recombinase|uniref:terminase gpP N-terminus-related DNA-binding protein n=1 Tax=Lampropedia hyalina TaxID=198706 RepID=UPI001161361B|nr:hypothetical protein [Lampropedia hyalina]